jgi:hypothetical protein
MKPLKTFLNTKSIVWTFGRFNPPTLGHAKLLQKIVSEAEKRNAIHWVYLSRTHDKKNNPLLYEQKMFYMSEMFPDNHFIDESGVISAFHACQQLSDYDFKDVCLVVGEDRAEYFHREIAKYIKEGIYKFDHFDVVSAGPRNDKEWSATKLRESAKKGWFVEFERGVPDKKLAKMLYEDVRRGLGII